MIEKGVLEKENWILYKCIKAVEVSRTVQVGFPRVVTSKPRFKRHREASQV